VDHPIILTSYSTATMCRRAGYADPRDGCVCMPPQEGDQGPRPPRTVWKPLISVHSWTSWNTPKLQEIAFTALSTEAKESPQGISSCTPAASDR